MEDRAVRHNYAKGLPRTSSTIVGVILLSCFREDDLNDFIWGQKIPVLHNHLKTGKITYFT